MVFILLVLLLLYFIHCKFKKHLKNLIQKSFFALKVFYNTGHIIYVKLLYYQILLIWLFLWLLFRIGMQESCAKSTDCVPNVCISHLYKDIGWLRMKKRIIFHFCTFLMKPTNNPCSPSLIKEHLIIRRTRHNVSEKNTIILTIASFSYNTVFYSTIFVV